MSPFLLLNAEQRGCRARPGPPFGNTKLLPTIWPHVVKQRSKPGSGLRIAINYQFDRTLGAFKVELLHLTVLRRRARRHPLPHT
jgi:hypothetical protein